MVLPICISVIIYFTAVIIIKNIPTLRVLYCPSCKYPYLTRIQRKFLDYIINILLLNTATLKRYKCKNCNWEGLKIKQ